MAHNMSVCDEEITVLILEIELVLFCVCHTFQYCVQVKKTKQKNIRQHYAVYDHSILIEKTPEANIISAECVSLYFQQCTHTGIKDKGKRTLLNVLMY